MKNGDQHCMQLMTNMLLEWAPMDNDRADLPSVERVLDFDIATDEVVVINIFDPKAFPCLRSYELILQAHRTETLKILEHDPFAKMMIPEKTISIKHRQHRDDAYKDIEALLSFEDPEFMFYPWKRGPLIKAHGSKTKRKNRQGKLVRLSHETIYKRLRLWWQSGRRKNAFLPNFDKCGARHIKRLSPTSQVD